MALDGYVRSTLSDIFALTIPIEDGHVMKYSYIESQIELQDSLWQIFSEPKEITLMNVDRLSFIQLPIPN